jgi:hypothetical protein
MENSIAWVTFLFCHLIFDLHVISSYKDNMGYLIKRLNAEESADNQGSSGYQQQSIAVRPASPGAD